jgi:8-oxo-dGTP diphosphatase
MAEKGRYIYEYPRPAVTVDAVLFTESGSEVLLIKRKFEPGKGSWALPGGFIELDEELECAVARELLEETGVDYRGQWLQVGAYGSVNRDPRGRVIMVAFKAFVQKDAHPLKAGDDAAEAQWFEISRLPKLAFDHLEVIEQAKNI